jgi:hypothetical protein
VNNLLKFVTRFSLIDVVIFLALTSTTLYALANNVPLGLGSFRFLWAPLSLIVVFISYPHIFISRNSLKVFMLAGLLVFLLPTMLWVYLTDWDNKFIINEFYGIIVFSILLYYFINKRRYFMLAIMAQWLYLFVIVTAIITHLVLFIDPLIVRNSAFSFDDADQLEIAKGFGVAGYGYVQAMVFLLPTLIYSIKSKKTIVFNRFFTWVIVGILVVLLIRSNVFANLLIAVPLVIVSFIGPLKSKYGYWVVSFFFLVLIAIPSEIYSAFFAQIGLFFEPGSFLNERFLDFSDFIGRPEGDLSTGVGARAARYPLLAEVFFSNPLFGASANSSTLDISDGGHLYFMYRLTIWGSVGFLLFVFMLYSIYKSVIKTIDDDFRYYYNLTVMAFVALGLIKNIAGREPWLFLFLLIPGLYFSMRHEKKASQKR